MKLFPATITTVSLLLLTCICTSIIYWLWFRYEQRLLQRKPELNHTVTHKSSAELESAPVMFHSTPRHASVNDTQHMSQLANNFRLPQTPKKRLINSELNRTAGFLFFGGWGVAERISIAPKMNAETDILYIILIKITSYLCSRIHLY